MPEEASINGVIRDLTQLVQVYDETVALWASDALNKLTHLRSLTAHLGFVQWTMANARMFRSDPVVSPAFDESLKALQTLCRFLDDKSIRKDADSQSGGAASRVVEAYKELAATSGWLR